MPITCTADSLADAADCFCGLNQEQRESIKLYLLATWAGIEPDKDALVAASKCFCGLSAPVQQRIQTYLLCQIANG